MATLSSTLNLLLERRSLSTEQMREAFRAMMAGEHDALNQRLAGIRRLQQALEAARLGDLTLRVYPGARHELLNETNRDDVTRDLSDWLDAPLAG